MADKFIPIIYWFLGLLVTLASYGFRKAIMEGKDTIFILTYASFAAVGIGSIFFHATLKYSMQLGMHLVPYTFSQRVTKPFGAHGSSG